MLWILGIVISYFLGSIPTAYIFGRLKGIDIRKFGSGNVGATNAARVLGKAAGLAVLVLDTLKGFIAVTFLADILLSRGAIGANEELRIFLGLSCILGHTWTIFLKFKGGKGIATTLGVLLGLSFKIPGLKIIVGLVILTWIIVFFIARIVSIASILASISLPICMFIFEAPNLLKLLSILLSFFIILRHKANLKRIFRGKEERFRFRKTLS